MISRAGNRTTHRTALSNESSLTEVATASAAEPSPADIRAIEAEWPVIEAELAIVSALAEVAAEPVHAWLWRRPERVERWLSGEVSGSGFSSGAVA